MIKRMSLCVCLMATVTLSAQTQQGIVKTKGRMVNGQYLKGQGLPGASVIIQGGNSYVVQNNNGSFSFPVPEKKFRVQNVQKKGYELVDADITRKSHQYSDNPLYLLMETPEQQMEDLLDAQEKISKTLREQLKKSRAEIQQLKDENKITEEEYRQRIAQLMEYQQNNQKLIADMAKEYAQMDYDQMDDKNQRISDAIFNGHLTEADSLLRSKGDIRNRNAEINKRRQAEALRKIEIEKEQVNLAASEEGTRRMLEDFGEDCYKYYNIFKLENKHDSAAYYIELRANSDTMNAKWQMDAAQYFNEQNQFKKAEKYSKTALDISRKLVVSDSTYYQFIAWSQALLGVTYTVTGRRQEALKLFEDFLLNTKKLAKQYPNSSKQLEWISLYITATFSNTRCEGDEKGQILNRELEILKSINDDNFFSLYITGATYCQLANYYSESQKFEDAEKMYKKAFEALKELSKIKPGEYDDLVSGVLIAFADFYADFSRFDRCEAIYNEALEINKRLSISNPQRHEKHLARTLYSLACFYLKVQKYQESEPLFIEALSIYRRLVDSDFLTYTSELSNTLKNLGDLYHKLQRFKESEDVLKESMEICRNLAVMNPQNHEESLATILINLASLYKDTKRFSESEAMYKEALEIYRRLVSISPKEYEPGMAGTLYDMGLLKVSMEQPKEAVPLFEEALNIFREKFKKNSAQREWYIGSLYCLGMLYSAYNHEKAYYIYEECLPLMKENHSNDPEQWTFKYMVVLGNQSYNCLFMKRFVQSEKYACEGLSLDSTQHWIISNFAASLLFQGKYNDSEKIYCKHRDELKSSFLNDLKQFAEAGVIPKKHEADVEKIKKLLNE